MDSPEGGGWPALSPADHSAVGVAVSAPAHGGCCSADAPRLVYIGGLTRHDKPADHITDCMRSYSSSIGPAALSNAMHAAITKSTRRVLYRTRWAHDFEEGGACCQNTKRLLHFIETDPGPCDDSNRRSRYHGSSAVGWLLSIVRQVFAMAPQTS
jgi:hypothetical protein